MNEKPNEPRKNSAGKQPKTGAKKKAKPTKSQGAKQAPTKSGGSSARREGVRQFVVSAKEGRLERLLASPRAMTSLGIAIGFIVLAATVAFFFRGSMLPAPGRTATETRTARVAFEFEVPEDTERQRELVRQNAPPVYRLERATIDAIVNALVTLPEALAATESFSDVDPGLIESFGLDEAAYEAIKKEVVEGEASTNWENAIGRAGERLAESVLLRSQAYQRIFTAGYNELVLVRTAPDDEQRIGERTTVRKDEALPIDGDPEAYGPKVRNELMSIANQSALYGPRAMVFVDRVLSEGQPTYRIDREATDAAIAEAVAGVKPVMRSYNMDEVIYTSGQRVDEATYGVAVQELRHFRASRTFVQAFFVWVGLAGVVSIIATAIGGYLWFFYPELLQHAWRLTALAGMLLGATLLSAWLATKAPDLVWSAVLTPTLFVGMIAVVAYDRRLAMLVGLASMMLTATALGLGSGAFIAGLVGVMLAAWRLADVRSRNDVVRGGLVTTAGVALGVVVVGLIEHRMTLLVVPELLADGATAGAGAFLASALLLVALPTIERVFDITTGMTLAELRDPQHPLLRQLQQRAPGTYNHALNVATIAESAADAIGADSLHTYVGAVYHDIGKMNKPDYFVENQNPGLNKHDRLSPAMSLLVIVGHVKDGVELAREYGLPKSLHHYIESHHGTTLVEYFYDQAKRQADADDTIDRPAEFEYRYPGPKPRTREAAILMLADASESAARAMESPTSARLEQLVQSLSRKRLLDGQFDECELTLRELTLIEGAIVRSLTSIYHGRIAYPKGEPEHAQEDERNEEGVVATG